ncbi:TetR/AcrR family transcriptional regulator [Mycetocola zhadangensis]|uniref:TetR family transcriptional regulator n=1 Tax=Mycetocola zhadangensis TaxID=1164595 RepID=A0A3L7J5T8_9MICO|nr:TetR/AcrR family transcriptional regulator [Mycetocola zhadangensis]RLQ85986.1 TetR family transcriptional regulator [Mycetocola zhadangensis]GGE87408.1 TetR family transcriptional regulator [Mycetocola zhadangensis]
MSDTDAQPVGLRARKRAATRSAIEQTAIRLVREHGYDHVTIEMVCDESQVSQRTFFNYFGSKEGVILGPPPSLDALDGKRFVAERGDDIVLDLVRIVASALLDDTLDAELLQARFLIITTTPELLGRQMVWMNTQEADLTDLVLRRFAVEKRTGDDLRDEAAMVVALAFTALRFALQKLFAESASGSAEDILVHASTLIRRIAQAG